MVNRWPSSRILARTLILAILMLLLAAAPAFAEAGNSGYLDWSVVSTMPGNAGSTSPHGAYATTTIKCGVCHAVHNAASTSSYGPPELLLATPVADACTYCHMNTASGYIQVYGGNPDNYSGTDFKNAHNVYVDGLGATQGVTCVKCHQVHAADNQMTANSYLTQKLLIGAKTEVFPPGTNYDPLAGAPLSTDDSATALTKYCAGCHFTLGVGYGYYETSYNSYTHIMTTATASYGNTSASYTGRVAWQDSTYCSSCHANEYGVAGRWPHYTNGMRFLESGANASASSTGAVETSEDGVCLRCHRNTAADGIGNDF